MAGLLGRKIGMTQVFDPEDGRVERVTVIEAGPCFVTGVRRAGRDGYDAVQLAYDEVEERKLTRPELGHLKQNGLGPHRRLAVVRGRLDEVREVAHAHGATVNDVLLAAIAGGLRELLRARGEPVDGRFAGAEHALVVGLPTEADGGNGDQR